MEAEDLEIAKSMPANFAVAYTRFIEKFDRIISHQADMKQKQIQFQQDLHNEKEERTAAITKVKEECKEESSDIFKAVAGWSVGALFIIACGVVGFFAYKL